MENITYGDIIIHYLKKDYIFKSFLLKNLSVHIDNLYDNFVLTTDDKKKINTLVSETINDLNNYYNTITLEVFKNTNNIKKIFCKKSDLNTHIEILDVLKEKNCINDFYSNLDIINYNEINIKLKKICNYIGLSTINDIFNLYGITEELINLDNKNNNDNNKLKLLMETFVPISSKYYKNINKKNNICEFILEKNIDEKYSLLLGNVYKIKINLNNFNTILEINGYIHIDSINSHIRTSQLCNEYLYNKKMYVMNALEKITDIDNFFKLSYVKNFNWRIIII